MHDLLLNLQNFLISGWYVLTSLFSLLLPWLPLAAWIAYWLFAVNWVKLREVLLQGGWVGVVLIGMVMILVWGTVAPPTEGYHGVLGLEVSNYVGKAVYVTSLFVIMLLCGSVQLSGCCNRWCCFEDEAAAGGAHH